MVRHGQHLQRATKGLYKASVLAWLTILFAPATARGGADTTASVTATIHQNSIVLQVESHVLHFSTTCARAFSIKNPDAAAYKGT